ncbi:MAG TPA: histidine--tRNA ligase [Bacteroidia bacterium]|nr:histidine--tRNA ligase [Bacteroidia bacterium]
MAAQKPSTPKGTRDFSPDEMMRRNFIFDTIRSVFKKYGYQPIETPAMENLETLMGKYGDEGDKLIFKIRSNKNLRDKLNDDKKKALDEIYDYWLPQNSDKALRYDLTVPFARFVVQHQNKLTFPFKRYQIQPVWRADNPQLGRYREFYQCDADVIGSKSLINEAELVQMVDEVFTKFETPVTIRISNRKVIAGIAEVAGVPDRMVDVAVTLDKYDKIGDKIFEDFRKQDFSEESIESLRMIVDVANECVEKHKEGDSNFGFTRLRQLFSDCTIGLKGVDEVEQVFKYLKLDNEVKNPLNNSELTFSLILARGLNYYTGAIFEVTSDVATLKSSICGGGRYDDLTGIFGLPNVSGVGISFGIDRIFDVLNEVGYPEDVTAKEGTRVLFANFGGEDEKYSLKLLKQVRDAGIAAEIYLDPVKMGKQFKYADDKKIPFVAIVGENERAYNNVTLKNMSTGEQVTVSFADLLEKIK